MTGQMQFPPEIGALLAESAEWRLLGLLFEYPDEAWRRRMSALIPSLEDHELRALAEAALRDAGAGLHFALFGPAGTVPVREVTHRGGVQFGYLMAELSAYYDAFGYDPGDAEAPDHLAVELGFLSFLKLKEAQARAFGETDRASVTADAATAFLHDHLAAQAEPVAHGLDTFAPAFLSGAGRRIRRHAGPAPRSGFPLSGPAAVDDGCEAMSCGPAPAAEELVQLTR